MSNKPRGPAEGQEEVALSVEDRLDAVEQALGRWRSLALIAAALMIPTWSWIGWQWFVPARNLRAHKLEIVNDKGTPVVVLQNLKAAGGITTQNADGRTLFTVAVDEFGDGLVETNNAKGGVMVSLSTTPTGGAIRVLNNMGKEVVGLQSNKANCGLLMAKDMDGTTAEALSGSRRGVSQTASRQ